MLNRKRRRVGTIIKDSYCCGYFYEQTKTGYRTVLLIGEEWEVPQKVVRTTRLPKGTRLLGGGWAQ